MNHWTWLLADQLYWHRPTTPKYNPNPSLRACGRWWGWLLERFHVGKNIDDILSAHTELVSGEHEGAPEGLDAFDHA